MEQHWVRVVMDRRTEALVRQLDCASLDAAEISGSRWRNAGFRSYATLAFPEFDICRTSVADAYDVLAAEQVWEHLEDPVRATANAFRMLRPGGALLLTTPFLLRYHPEPLDCWRWTADGMRRLLLGAGFDPGSLVVESWGNRACLLANLDHWAVYQEGLHSLSNEPDVPLVVWALARRPA